MQSIKWSTRLICLTGFLLWIGSCTKEEPLDTSLVKPLFIKSAYTGTTYPVYVVLPADYKPGIKYATIYVLDGDDETGGNKVYDFVGKKSQEISAQYQKQNAMIVAIGSTEDRIRDYAPTPLKQFGNQGGGTVNYAKFLEKELIPRIEEEFSVDTNAAKRTISGHSLGGSVAGFMFAKHHDVFSNYLMLSPAYWWDDGIGLKYELENRPSNALKKCLVYVGCGEFEEGIAILAEEWYLRMKKYYPNCTTAFYKIPNTGHISSASEDLERALDFYYQHQ